MHPGYKAAPEELKSGDAAPLMQFMNSSDDLALIKLEHEVRDVTPTRIYRRSDENGRIVKIVGAGATGNGLIGECPNSSHRGELRTIGWHPFQCHRMRRRIESATFHVR